MDVVLVHGLAGSSRWWARVLPPLARRHRVHALDVPRLWPRADPAAWLDERTRGLDGAVLVGHSFGGLLCAAVAARRPERFAAIALVAPAGLPLGRSLVQFAPGVLGALRLAGPRFLARLVPDALRAGPLSLFLGARYALDADLTAELARVEMPALLVWGERDGVIRADLASAWLAALPDARAVVLPGVGHVPMAECADELARVLLRFLEELEREPR